MAHIQKSLWWVPLPTSVFKNFKMFETPARSKARLVYRNSTILGTTTAALTLRLGFTERIVQIPSVVLLATAQDPNLTTFYVFVELGY